jgi:hypothetical protein
MLILVSLTIVALVSGPASAKKKKNAEPAEAVEEVADECPEPTLVRENTLEGCRDREDNDGDGHVDCDDQDCEIYTICLEQPAPKKAPQRIPPSYTSMRPLKEALRGRVITPAEFHRQWQVIRQNRSREMDRLRVDYQEGKITRHQYRNESRMIKLKYEG